MTGSGKRKERFITSNAIAAHGKAASSLVFERERSDNVLTKYGQKLCSWGDKQNSGWISKQVLVTKARDFRIKEDLLVSAKERELAAARTKSGDGKAKGKRKFDGKENKTTREEKTEKVKKAKKEKKILRKGDEKTEDNDEYREEGDEQQDEQEISSYDDDKDKDSEVEGSQSKKIQTAIAEKGPTNLLSAEQWK